MTKNLVERIKEISSKEKAKREQTSAPTAGLPTLSPISRIIDKVTNPEKAKSEQQRALTQMPLWPEFARALPNEILRSALFNARNRKRPRVLLKDEAITVIGDGRITYRGEELRQDDETVWLQLVHLTRGRLGGQPVEFTAYAFCKAIDWSINKQSYTRLHECLKRMQATGLDVYATRLQRGLSLSMIPYFEYEDPETREALPRWRVRIAPELIELFGESYFTRIEWEQRLRLPDGLATWLQGYLATHRTPYPIKIETIARGAGLTETDMPELRRMTKRALGNLVEVGFILEWSIEKDLVAVKRTQSQDLVAVKRTQPHDGK